MQSRVAGTALVRELRDALVAHAGAGVTVFVGAVH
jgi:hypothetical protein